MFVSASYISINYGVHDEIAKFFADREPPADNLYWHKKLMYLRPEPASLFIPAMVDLLYRLGIPRKELLSDKYILLMEQVAHISAKEEFKEITHAQSVEECIELTKGIYVNKKYFNALVDFMRGGKNNFIAPLATPFKALHRGDVFLFSLCSLDFDDDTAVKIVQHWFALISSFLLMDDAEDIEPDSKSGDANAFLESGLDYEGIERIKALFLHNLELIKAISKSLARTIDTKFSKLAQEDHIKKYINLKEHGIG